MLFVFFHFLLVFAAGNKLSIILSIKDFFSFLAFLLFSFLKTGFAH
jgi:Sec-independent protein secretion pathway component TatC